MTIDWDFHCTIYWIYNSSKFKC